MNANVVVGVLRPPFIDFVNIGSGLRVPLIKHWVFADFFWLPVGPATSASPINNPMAWKKFPSQIRVVRSGLYESAFAFGVHATSLKSLAKATQRSQEIVKYLKK